MYELRYTANELHRQRMQRDGKRAGGKDRLLRTKLNYERTFFQKALNYGELRTATQAIDKLKVDMYLFSFINSMQSSEIIVLFRQLQQQWSLSSVFPSHNFSLTDKKKKTIDYELNSWQVKTNAFNSIMFS